MHPPPIRADLAAVETAARLGPDGRVLFFQRVIEGRERIFWVELSSVVPAD